MPTLHREAGFRFVIYPDDHEPAHLHVLGTGEAKVVLKGADDEPELVYATGMSRSDERRVMRIVKQLQQYFLAGWMEIHG